MGFVTKEYRKKSERYFDPEITKGVSFSDALFLGGEELTHNFPGHVSEKTGRWVYDLRIAVVAKMETFVGGWNVSSSAALGFDETFAIESILLPDGTTPESQGYTISNDFGWTSPNLIPEPSTLLLGAMASLGLLVRRRR